MNKKLPVLILTGALACAVFSPALAAEKAPTLTPPAAYVEEVQTLPNSVLYYGTLTEIVRDEDGSIFQLYMDSEQSGEYVMNISEQTAWIDSANHTAADPAALQEGQSLYVFHSPIATLSLPPQSAAFAVVTNLPMDAQSAQLHKVEEVSLQDGPAADHHRQRRTVYHRRPEHRCFCLRLRRRCCAGGCPARPAGDRLVQRRGPELPRPGLYHPPYAPAGSRANGGR